MTKNELDTWRKRAPWFISVIGFLPWAVLNAKNLEEAKFRTEVFVPFAAVIFAFFYVGTSLRRSLWKSEMDAHVGKQIREALLDMIPSDLGVTQSEKGALAQREVYKDLTGVFWEAVDGNEILRSHKEHFYANGIMYSTSMDVYILGVLVGLLYAVDYLLTQRTEFAYVAAGCVAIAVASRVLVTPSRRKRHLELSKEQLDFFLREQSEFVSNRFRDIVIGWRVKNGGKADRPGQLGSSL